MDLSGDLVIRLVRRYGQAALLCKAKKQWLLNWKASSYCPLALDWGAHLGHFSQARLSRPGFSAISGAYKNPSKHKTFVKHLYNADPTSMAMVKHRINVIQMFCVYWVGFFCRASCYAIFGFGLHLLIIFLSSEYGYKCVTGISLYNGGSWFSQNSSIFVEYSSSWSGISENNRDLPLWNKWLWFITKPCWMRNGVYVLFL